ncbi:MAG TPA: beta-mannosidase [Polyangiaceae bacterium]|nr:beta-mannosidase [Polyangiaceae bacterium]
MTPHDSGAPRPGFVAVKAGRFSLDGKQHRFVGANLWYAAYLGADAPYGDRARLGRELDRLAGLGVTHLRILAGSETSPLQRSLSPAFCDASPDYDAELLGGLDFVLDELRRRGLHAILYLTNFWEWSGGMVTYRSWVNDGRYVDRDDDEASFFPFVDFASGFYADAPAVALYHAYVRALVTRVNERSGVRYADDPAIFSWQLANEPRPAAAAAQMAERSPGFLAWIRDTARLIKSVDPVHLVSTGSEGLMGCLGDEACLLLAHAFPEVDYLTAHVWPQNWGWVSPDDLAGTHAEGERRALAYVAAHEELAERLGRPLVIEEYGFPRDGGFEPGSSTHFRDRFVRLILERVEQSAARDGALSGSQFWAWGGEGRAQHSDRWMRSGDTGYLGDPPHEPQGWYSVFDRDESTLELLGAHARRLGKR